MTRCRKAWNGGSIEAAMRAARERVDVLVRQGATICDKCGGDGGSEFDGLCQECFGAGCVLPEGGLKLGGKP